MPNISPTDDIDQILVDAYTESMKSMIRNSVPYQMGVKETISKLEEIFNQQNKNYFETLKNYAEFYYSVVKDKFPDINIKQYRIGIDSTTTSPTILMVISNKDKNLLPDIRNIARNIELFLWKKFRWDGNFWTQTDKNIVQNSINNDFPYERAETD